MNTKLYDNSYIPSEKSLKLAKKVHDLHENEHLTYEKIAQRLGKTFYYLWKLHKWYKANYLNKENNHE